MFGVCAFDLRFGVDYGFGLNMPVWLYLLCLLKSVGLLFIGLLVINSVVLSLFCSI